MFTFIFIPNLDKLTWACSNNNLDKLTFILNNINIFIYIILNLQNLILTLKS